MVPPGEIKKKNRLRMDLEYGDYDLYSSDNE